MTLGDFWDLPFGLQLDLLLQDGDMLLSRAVGPEKRVLFSFESYYVEAGWDKNGQLKFIRSFQGTQGLEPYLTQIDWHKLV